MARRKGKKGKSLAWYKKTVVETLRHYSSAFDPADGYDLRYIREWTPAQKAKITRTMELVNALRAQPHKVYRPRKKERLAQAQQWAHERRTPILDVAFMPVADPDKPARIRFRKDKITISQMGVSKSKVDIDFDLLMADPEAAIKMATDMADADAYGIQAGKYEFTPTFSDAELLAEEIIRLMHKYGTENKHDPNDPNSHHHKNWLHGILAFYFDDLDNFESFSAKREEERKMHKRRLKAHYARMRYLKKKAWGHAKKQKKGK